MSVADLKLSSYIIYTTALKYTAMVSWCIATAANSLTEVGI